MYRRSLEMENQQQEENSQDKDCDFLGRVTQLPVVRSVMDTTLDTYNKVKGTNRVVSYMFNNAEKTAQLAVNPGKRIAVHFELQFAFFRVVACKTLDKLEKSAPIITKRPEEIINDTIKLYEDVVKKPINNAKEYGMCKVNSIKDYGVQKATTFANTRYGQVVTGAVDTFLNKADCYVDYYLPCGSEGGEERHCEAPPPSPNNTVEKAVVLSRKLRHRLYCHGQIRLQATKRRIEEILAKLHITADLINDIKSNMAEKNQVLNEKIAQAKIYFAKIWDEINAANPETGVVKSFEQKLLIVAKELTLQLQQASQKILSVVTERTPTRFHSKIETAQIYVESLYTQFAKTESWNDVSQLILEQLQDTIKYLETIYSELYDSAVQKKPLSWLEKPNESVVSNGSVNQSNEVASDGPPPTENDYQDNQQPNETSESGPTTDQQEMETRQECQQNYENNTCQY